MVFSIADKWLVAGVHLLHCVSLFAQQTRHAIVDTQTHRQLPPQCELDWSGGGCSRSRHVTKSVAGEPVNILGPSYKQHQRWKRSHVGSVGSVSPSHLLLKVALSNPSEAENLSRIRWAGSNWVMVGWGILGPRLGGFRIGSRDKFNPIYNVTSQLSIATVVNRSKLLY